MDSSTPSEHDNLAESAPASTPAAKSAPAAAPARPHPSYFDPPPEPERPFWARIPWGLVIFVLVMAAAGGWYYYHSYWEYRLPQDRKLTDLQGQVINARLEACSDTVLQYISPDNGTTQYVAISTLSAADQEFAQHLNQTLKIDYPFECALAPEGVTPTMVRVEGQNGDWVKYTLLSDHSTHYVPFSAFSTSDQIILQQLPSKLTVEFPMTYTVKGLQGEIFGTTVLGRSDAAVKLGMADGSARYVPLSELSALDQKLVKLAGTTGYLSVPLECVLTDTGGKKLYLRVEGRSVNTIKYTLLSDGLTYYAPITDFSDMDQKMLRMLQSNLVFEFPFEYTLRGEDGKPMRVRLEGRTPNIVQYTLMADGRNHYQLISSFSQADRMFLQLLPADLRLVFPLDYTLISKTGQELDAHLLGRSNNQVKFTLSDGKTYNYALSDLADESAAFLQLLPSNLVEADMVADAPPVQAPPPSPLDQLPALRSQLEPLVKDDIAMQANVDATPTSTTNTTSLGYGRSAFQANPERDRLLGSLDDNRSKVASLCMQINDILTQDPKLRVSETVQNWWDEVMLFIKHNNDKLLSLSSGNPSLRDPTLKQIRENGRQIDYLLSKIFSETGNYSP